MIKIMDKSFYSQVASDRLKNKVQALKSKILSRYEFDDEEGLYFDNIESPFDIDRILNNGIEEYSQVKDNFYLNLIRS